MKVQDQLPRGFHHKRRLTFCTKHSAAVIGVSRESMLRVFIFMRWNNHLTHSKRMK